MVQIMASTPIILTNYDLVEWRILGFNESNYQFRVDVCAENRQGFFTDIRTIVECFVTIGIIRKDMGELSQLLSATKHNKNWIM